MASTYSGLERWVEVFVAEEESAVVVAGAEERLPEGWQRG
jgi:hypothetical protein